MELITSVQEMRARRLEFDCAVGFVPTMGALHSGHKALIERSVSDNDVTIVSIYVNPTQFDNPSDLSRYPDRHEADLALARSLGVDIVFAPAFDDIYPDQFRFEVNEKSFSNELCGAHRPGHFTGVLTVVMKLLNIVRPQRAYFGEKDFQQLQLIRDMAASFFLDVDVVACATIREPDGLALSSRNLNLDCDSRRVAPMLYRTICESKSDADAIAALTALGFDVDYVQTQLGRRFVAAFLGTGTARVRLIDNVSFDGEIE